MFQNEIGRFQNVSKKTLKNNWMFEYFKFSNYLGCLIYQISAQRGIKSLIKVLKSKKKEVLITSKSFS